MQQVLVMLSSTSFATVLFHFHHVHLYMLKYTYYQR